MARGALTYACLILFLAAVSTHAARVSSDFAGRNLLQTESIEAEEPVELTPEEREAAREAAALAAFAEEQERKANESALIIEEATITAQASVERYLNNSKFNSRVDVLTELLRNADGVALKFTLNTLMVDGGKQAKAARQYTHRALGKALREGYGSNVARAVAYAFTIIQNDGDHLNFLDAIVFRQRKLDQLRTDSGCTFIKNLFTDADVVAHRRGDSMAFVASFDSEEYLPQMECFLDACTGRAGQCCTRAKPLRRGQCGCTPGGRCDFNIFSNRPRTIWVCSAAGCAPNQKCLCPEVA